ncbi:MAG: hypothetical protein ACM65L_10910 [Microcoleus sp.]
MTRASATCSAFNPIPNSRGIASKSACWALVSQFLQLDTQACDRSRHPVQASSDKKGAKGGDGQSETGCD